MGQLFSTQRREQKKLNDEINRALSVHRSVYARTQKLLLLGAAECGKSTILKQMRILHDNGFTVEEVEMQRHIIYDNAVHGMRIMLEARVALGLIAQTATEKKEYIDVVYNAERGTLTDKLVSALKELWKDETIQECYQRRVEFQLSDSVKYFLDDLDRIAQPDYIPSDQDILYTRVPTNGVSEVKFLIKGRTFRVFDVGGQRSERRKWMHVFDNVNAIIFLAAVSEYDQVLVEDNETNRMHEAMALYKQICNSPIFPITTSLILFLNKKDLFAEKLKRKSIKVAFPDYMGGDGYDECMAYIEGRFAALKEQEKKMLFVHQTCATDTNQVQLVIEGVIDTILKNNVTTSGIT